jgi:hypothetical protein
MMDQEVVVLAFDTDEETALGTVFGVSRLELFKSIASMFVSLKVRAYRPYWQLLEDGWGPVAR